MSYLEPGDVVVVTGAAQGIGRAVAIELAKRGARLALWDVLVDGCTETAEACRALGGQAHQDRVDVADDAAVLSAAERVAERFGSCFGLVSNAAIFPRATILESTSEMWRSVLGVNLLGAVFCAKALAPLMRTLGRGAIVNISSTRAFQGTPRGAHYAASKAALLSFTKSLALELAPTIRVNAVVPGVTETAQPLADTTLGELRSRGPRIPLGRIGQPDDIAAVVAFLLSNDARYVTGQALAVNGGGTMLP